MIELRTLGTLQLRDARGRDLCEKLQPKRLALLVYLAHAPRRYHRRDSLLALFWPELDGKGARNSLRQSLYSLRRTLGEGVITGRGYEEIGVADTLRSDVVALESALKNGQPEEAIELHQGRFLEGFHVQNVSPEFEHWLESERGRLNHAAVRAALGLLDREETLGNLSAAVRWARTAARLDPDDERIVQQLIELLNRAGDRAGAVRAYEAFARRARDEYDLAPAEETQALIETVRAHTETGEPASAPEPGVHEPPTTFIGRERELASLEQLLANPDARLLTLTGLGGVGKSRLALRLAHRVGERFKEGVAIVGLTDVRGPDDALSAIAHALGLKEDGRRDPRAALHGYLANRELFLLLDGFEPIGAVGTAIVGLLEAAPRLTILAASRAPLKLSGEREFPVAPLTLPQSGTRPHVEFPLNSEAVALFVDRARGARPDFHLTAKNLDAVAEICRRLDGLPLAIELAAARVKTLTPEAIARRLENRFAFLTGGPTDLPVRHQTLEAAIAWSCELLDESERALFRRLSVFAGGFGLELVEPLFEANGFSAVKLIDGLATLVDHSLISQTEIAGEPRFEMLDTVHAYARNLLAGSGEGETWGQRHAERIVAWVEEGERHYCRPEQDAWLRSLERDHDNIRAALRWALGEGKTPLAVRLGAAIWPFWWGCSYLSEARSSLEEILSLPGRAPRIARAKALIGASWMAVEGAKYENAVEYAKKSAALYRSAGDDPGRIRALETLGYVRLEAGDIEAAEPVFEECLQQSRAFGDARRKAIALEALSQVALARGDDEKARFLLRESVTIARRIGHTAQVGQGLLYLGDIAHRSGKFEGAIKYYDEALAIHRAAGQKINIASDLSSMGSVLVERGQLPAARDCYAEALSLFQELGYARGIARALTGIAAISLARGDAEPAVRLLSGVQSLLEQANDRMPPDDATAFESVETSAREQLPPSRFSDCWDEGRLLDEEALLALVVDGVPTERRRATG